ncbi:MAG: beta-lactamase family protein [Lachnospiraceae bacterium]|nr:beta-lactamase family protein [Lachnospiraceae bacterium]
MYNGRKLDAAIERVMKMNPGPAGLVCAVSKDGETVYTRYEGFADEQTGRKMQGDTIFDIWSLTKVFVCTAAMTLFEQGAFLLNDPLDYYFPEYRDMQVYERDNWTLLRTRPAKTRITIRDCFTMATGFPYATNFGTDKEVHPTIGRMLDVKKALREKLGRPYTLQEEIHAMAEVPLAFDPGTQWMYGYSHELVAGLVELCSGMRLSEYLKKTFFEPMGMKSTGYHYEDGWKERQAAFYSYNQDGKRIPFNMSISGHEPDEVYEAGGGGILSTAEDMLKFFTMLANDGIYQGEQYIGRKTIDLMRRNHITEVQRQDFMTGAHNAVYMPGYGYGLGVRTMIDPAGGFCNGSKGEFGWTGGSGTWAAADPEERFAVVYMHQLWPNLEEVIHQRIRAAAYGGIL